MKPSDCIYICIVSIFSLFCSDLVCWVVIFILVFSQFCSVLFCSVVSFIFSISLVISFQFYVFAVFIFILVLVIRCKLAKKNGGFGDVIISLFACWFQPAQTNQPTVFSSHKKPAPASPNQHQHQPANRQYVLTY